MRTRAGRYIAAVGQRIAGHLPELVLLANAGAFSVLLLELLLLGHTDGIQRVAPVTAASGAFLCMFAVITPRRLRVAPAVFLLLLSGAGFVGFARHLDERDASLFSVSTVRGDDDDDGDNSGSGGDDDDDDDAEPPPLAPLGLTGTAGLSAIAAFAGSRPRQS